MSKNIYEVPKYCPTCETYRCSNTLYCVTCHNAQRALEAWKESYLKARQPQKDAPDDNHESENGLEA